VPREVGVGTNTIYTPTQHHTNTTVTHTIHPPGSMLVLHPDLDEHMPECARDDVDAEHGFAHFEACFPGSSHVTSMGTLLVTFLVNDEIIPMKIENLPRYLRCALFIMYNLIEIYI
jgi:hypothetical protein